MLLPGPTTANKETTHNPKAKLYMNVFVCIIQSKKKTKNQKKDNDKQNAQKLKKKRNYKKKMHFLFGLFCVL